MEKVRAVFKFWILLIILLTVCTGSLPAIAFCKDDLPADEEHRLQSASQLLVVREKSFLFFTWHKLDAMERDGEVWRRAFPAMNAVVGRNGIALPGEKREGDGQTPSGLYRLSLAFGYPEEAQTAMPYRQATDDDLWVDDPDAPDYNRWVKQGETSALSFEKMKRDDDQYRYGLVIEYNTDPVIPGFGSAIFLHIWKEQGSPTAGCVAVSEEDILKIMAWLDPPANPLIWIHAKSIDKETPPHE